MRSVRSTASRLCLNLVPLLLITATAQAQENSPYSRYGLGDVVPAQPVAAKGMGGLSAAFADAQAVNTYNPASYGQLSVVTYDFGGMLDTRILRRNRPEGSYNSTNVTPNYITLALPLSKKNNLGMALGLRPVTRINYNINQNTRLSGIDSINRIFEGSGGMNQVFVGLGKTWVRRDSARVPLFRLSLGANGGYIFGRKNTTTTIGLVNDTVLYEPFIFNSNTTYGAAFAEGGLQLEATLGIQRTEKNVPKRRTFLRMGLMGSLQRKMNAQTDSLVTNFVFSQGRPFNQDTVIRRNNNNPGTITLPASYTIGFTIGSEEYSYATYDKWTLGVEYSSMLWNNFRYLGQADRVQNSSILRIGGSISPRSADPAKARSIFSTGTYRLGFYTGKDYINADGQGLNVSAFTLGFGFNLRRFRSYDNQFTQINLAVEAGRRGSGVNNISEQFVRASLGLSLSDIWFIKRKYE